MVCISCAWELMSNSPDVRGCYCPGCMWIKEARISANVDQYKVKQ